MTKSIAPFQLRTSIHRIIENMILGRVALPYRLRIEDYPHIYNYVMLKVICQQLFNRLVTSILIYRITYPATNQ